MKRKLFYPKNQIKNVGYTFGKEYAISDFEKEYIGYYHVYTDNVVFTGQSPSRNSLQLIKYVDESSSSIYGNLKQEII